MASLSWRGFETLGHNLEWSNALLDLVTSCGTADATQNK